VFTNRTCNLGKRGRDPRMYEMQGPRLVSRTDSPIARRAGPPGDRRSALCPTCHRSRTPPARDQFPDLPAPSDNQLPGLPAPAGQPVSRPSDTRQMTSSWPPGIRWTTGCPAFQHPPGDRSPDPPTPARSPVSRSSYGPEVAFWVVPVFGGRAVLLQVRGAAQDLLRPKFMIL
jgi:hypothetical protein